MTGDASPCGGTDCDAHGTDRDIRAARVMERSLARCSDMRPLLLIAGVAVAGALGVTAAAALVPGHTPRSAPASSPSGTLVTYHRVGGFAGVDDRVLIYADGRVRIRSRERRTGRTTLSPARLRKLRAALVAARFDQPYTAPPSACSDCFEFDLRHDGVTVHVTEGLAPTRFDGVLRQITPLVDG